MIGLNEELKLRESQGKPVHIGYFGTGQMGIGGDKSSSSKVSDLR